MENSVSAPILRGQRELPEEIKEGLAM